MRNTANGIVQLTYGDDGLDPLLMEGSQKGRPLDFPRCLATVCATHPRPRSDLALLPADLHRMADQCMVSLGAPLLLPPNGT